VVVAGEVIESSRSRYILTTWGISLYMLENTLKSLSDVRNDRIENEIAWYNSAFKAKMLFAEFLEKFYLTARDGIENKRKRAFRDTASR